MSFDEVQAGVRAYLTERLPAETAGGLLGTEEFNLDARLEQLARWRVVTRWQDPARTGEDFLRRRDRYQLTPPAARLHGFWTLEPGSDEAAADLTLAPRAIHDRLATFGDAVRDRSYPAAAAEFQQIIALHQAMALAARTWQRGLAHALSGGPDPEKQDVLWRTLQAYVGMWGEQVDVHTPRIATVISELTPMLTETVWRACARSSLADDVSEEIIGVQAARWSRTWTALTSWFSGVDGQARRLRRQLRDLVAPWARNMHILMDTGGAVTRRADLMRLARVIERAPDEETAWRIWDTAVGVFRARHLLVPADATDDHAQPWASAPPAPVTARFRAQGARASVGRRARAVDYSAGRAAARRARAASLAARADAEALLRVRSGTRLAEWSTLSDPELDLLLELLGLTRKGDDQRSRSAVTGDGRWQVRLTPPDGVEGTAAVTSPRGSLVTTNWLFELEPTR